MNAITANELKTRGVAVFEEHLAEAPEAVISVRGKERYVVMSVEHYREMREIELEAAWMRVKADLETGRYRKDPVEQHLARISAE
jgi:PHD/YefM family antitoxin component YafN of YafNO toxin-antitoxin module